MKGRVLCPLEITVDISPGLLNGETETLGVK